MFETQECLNIADVKVGDKVRCEFNVGDDSCMPDHSIREVKSDHYGNLYVDCNTGRHFLDGQVDSDEGLMVGVFAVPPDHTK